MTRQWHSRRFAYQIYSFGIKSSTHAILIFVCMHVWLFVIHTSSQNDPSVVDALLLHSLDMKSIPHGSLKQYVTNQTTFKIRRHRHTRINKVYLGCSKFVLPYYSHMQNARRRDGCCVLNTRAPKDPQNPEYFFSTPDVSTCCTYGMCIVQKTAAPEYTILYVRIMSILAWTANQPYLIKLPASLNRCYKIQIVAFQMLFLNWIRHAIRP